MEHFVFSQKLSSLDIGQGSEYASAEEFITFFEALQSNAKKLGLIFLTI